MASPAAQRSVSITSEGLAHPTENVSIPSCEGNDRCDAYDTADNAGLGLCFQLQV